MRYLIILEVSQKQAYIFASNKLQDNILNSEVIAYVLSGSYLKKTLPEELYMEENNMVYSGGGHTILEFTSLENAISATQLLTETIYKDFDGLLIFAKTIKYDETKTPEENLKELTKELEKKKSLKEAAFHQGSYGIEQIDPNTLDVKEKREISSEKAALKETELQREQQYYPEGYAAAMAFRELGGTKDDSNFISVVHIDGNGMGKRVENLYKLLDGKSWTETKEKLRMFSSDIDRHFKEALRETALVIGEQIDAGVLDDLSIHKEKARKKFPLRRLITAGDDICFVTEGRIGIEAASVFIQKLSQKINSVDSQNYVASAGVAIVHQKYPFYRAYELAEMLCSNAKKFGASISPADNGSSVGAIDWHIEFGELKDTLEEIRKHYITADGKELGLKPYFVLAPDEIMQNTEYVCRNYRSFKKQMKLLIKVEGNYPEGKIKELRGALKQGEKAANNFLEFNRMADLAADFTVHTQIEKDTLFSGIDKKRGVFIPQPDGKDHCMLFDAIELMDTYLCFKEGE